MDLAHVLAMDTMERLGERQGDAAPLAEQVRAWRPTAMQTNAVALSTCSTAGNSTDDEENVNERSLLITYPELRALPQHKPQQTHGLRPLSSALRACIASVLLLGLAGCISLAAFRTWLQRRQYLEQNRHSTEPDACIDKWAIVYPTEVDDWNRHSCSWKLKWGQCEEFKACCAHTCGQCNRTSGEHLSDGAEQEVPDSAMVLHFGPRGQIHRLNARCVGLG